MFLLLSQIFLLSFACQMSAKNLSNLHEMAKCHLGYDISVYNGHGCWCAVNDGIKKKSVDAIDECCALHEKCYVNSSCKNVLQKFLFYPYNWTCDGSNYKAYEKIKRGKAYVTLPKSRPTIKCTSVNVGCKKDMCNCDKALVECLAKYKKPACKKICPTTKSLVRKVGTVRRKVSALLWLKIGEEQSEQLDLCEENNETDFGIANLFNDN